MKVLHIVSTINPEAGGVSQAINTIISELNDYHVESEVVSIDPKNATFLSNCDYKVYAMGPRKSSWSYSSLLQKWLIDNINAYDCIILHGLWQYQSLALCQSIMALQVHDIASKVFVMPHGMLDPYFQKAKERRLKAARNYLIWHIVEKKLLRICAGVLFTCETEKLLARTTFSNYLPKSEIVVGLGVDEPPFFSDNMTNAFQQKLNKTITADKYLLFISRIHPKKGVDLLIRGYQDLKRKGKKALPKLVIAGPGLETSYGQEMLALASNDGDIYFPGMLEGDAKWGAFYNADAFILPSHQENFGIAVAEALACSKPVIITNKVNIWREIESMNGGIVTNDDLEGVIEGLTRWIETSENDRAIMRQNAFNTYSKYFTAEATSKKFVKIINNNLENVFS